MAIPSYIFYPPFLQENLDPPISIIFQKSPHKQGGHTMLGLFLHYVGLLLPCLTLKLSVIYRGDNNF